MKWFDYVAASVDEVTVQLGSFSKQRVHQILMRYKDDPIMHSKILEARDKLKRSKFLGRKGCSLEEAKSIHLTWNRIIGRLSKDRAYADCTITFEDCGAFQKWCLTQVGFRNAGWHLDKDILIKGNREYGPNTCAFVPREINSLMVNCLHSRKRGDLPLGVTRHPSKKFVALIRLGGNKKYLGIFDTPEDAFEVYKAEKLKRIQDVAEKYKGQIDPRVYTALMDWKVEITD